MNDSLVRLHFCSMLLTISMVTQWRSQPHLRIQNSNEERQNRGITFSKSFLMCMFVYVPVVEYM